MNSVTELLDNFFMDYGTMAIPKIFGSNQLGPSGFLKLLMQGCSYTKH